MDECENRLHGQKKREDVHVYVGERDRDRQTDRQRKQERERERGIAKTIEKRERGRDGR